MRPKSIATVVVALLSTPVRLSVPTLAAVRVSSVVNGSISLTARTNVVLPAPNPPAMRILNAVGNSSELFSETMQQCLQSLSVGGIGGDAGGSDGHCFPLDKVGQQDLGDHHRLPQMS